MLRFRAGDLLPTDTLVRGPLCGPPAPLPTRIIGPMLLSPSHRQFVTHLGLFAALLYAPLAAAEALRAGDRVLLVSTRPVGCATEAATLATGVEGAEYTGCWNAVDAPATLATLDPSTPTIFYVHGNRIEPSDARVRGLAVYRRLVACAADDRPIQFVIFSWCSEKERGLLRDYRVKAARTRPVAWQLAWTIDRLPASTPVGLLGYSYGARVCSGTAHLMGGGSLSGLTYSPSTECAGCRRPLRAVYLAAAMDACWLSPRSYHGQALERLESLLVTLDPRDPAMKFYKFVPRLADPPALGDVGPQGLDAAYAARVCTLNVASAVGHSHDLYRYLAAPGVMPAAWRRLTFADAASLPTPTLAAASSHAGDGA
ncbi:hypothetical protein [Botrimarina hoheduenensis]|uniref:Alpha/beta hydrolase family protein n=1 Tax=Botrimarina hoheduenensis TaxID=2528000 RepID=A0A5C5W8A2_9BACT|nr:hypothetical protein [Botrimarina hoheduenensis]TWT46824.1 hypothetical protein Pla111_19260 [Botrimarina hoheduenensis]